MNLKLPHCNKSSYRLICYNTDKRAKDKQLLPRTKIINDPKNDCDIHLKLMGFC